MKALSGQVPQFAQRPIRHPTARNFAAFQQVGNPLRILGVRLVAVETLDAADSPESALRTRPPAGSSAAANTARPTPVYALVAGKKRARLQESAAGDAEKHSCKIQTPQQRTDGLVLRSLICKKTGMEALASMLPNIAPAYIDLPVDDLTELRGLYDFTLDWTPRGGGRGAADRGGDAPAAVKAGDVPATSEPDGVTVFDAL
jgi:hypothetical protein